MNVVTYWSGGGYAIELHTSQAVHEESMGYRPLVTSSRWAATSARR